MVRDAPNYMARHRHSANLRQSRIQGRSITAYITKMFVIAIYVTAKVCDCNVYATSTVCDWFYFDSCIILIQYFYLVDGRKSEQISRLLNYINSQPLLSDVWHVIPLDLRLSTTLFSICTTYLVVIIQFTHLYD